jgi:transcriptional regulator
MSRDLFTVTEGAEIEAMLASVRLGSLVTHGPAGLCVTHMPFLYDASTRTLRGHIARSNAQRGRDGGGDALALFVGPNAYVSPNSYPSKQQHGQVVPTWNYQSVEVYGALRWTDDRDWLRTNVAALTDRFEAEQHKPWSLSDAPADYVERLLGAIVGVELAVSRVEARRKLSQNRTEPDRLGVLAGFLAGDAAEQAVAELMREPRN